MSRLSVIVTSYNIHNYIGQCLESVCHQTLRDIEIIVVDDGSDDGTARIVLDFASRDSRIKPVLFAENTIGGVASAANAGLDEASATYVGFVDGDDYCEPEMFEKLLAAAERYDSDLAMCRYSVVDSETGALAQPADEDRWVDLDSPAYELGIDEQRRFLRFIAVPWRKIYRRSMLEKNGIRFPVGDYFYEDNPFHWFSVLSARRMAVVPRVLCFHRVGRGGQTMQTGTARLFTMFDHHATIREWIAEHADAAEFNAPLLGWVISQLEWIGPRTPRDLRRRLFDTVRPIIAQYEDHTIREALVNGQKGARAAALVQAVQRGNYAGFIKAVDADTAGSSRLVSARYHLQYSGFRTTTQLTIKYAREKAALALQQYRRRRAERSVPVDEMFFALTVLDQRLRRIEDHLARAERASALAKAAEGSSNLANVRTPNVQS